MDQMTVQCTGSYDSTALSLAPSDFIAEYIVFVIKQNIKYDFM